MSVSAQSKSNFFKWAMLVTALIAGVVALGIAWYDYRFPSWEEEVLLPDGRTITVKQRRDFIEGYGTRKTWLTFSLPEMGGERVWGESLMPSIIGVEQEKVYVLGMPRGPKQYGMYGGPKYFLVAFVWGGTSFQRIPLDEVPSSIKQSENVFRCLPSSRRKNITWAEKISLWCESPTAVDIRSRVLDYKELESLSKKYARMDGHTTFSN